MKNDPNLVDSCYSQLLQSLPADVATRVTAKYEADRAGFLKWAEEKMPSKDPSFWAKANCTKCYGRGILTRVILNQPKIIQSCSCATKNYTNWLRDIRTEYNLRSETCDESK